MRKGSCSHKRVLPSMSVNRKVVIGPSCTFPRSRAIKAGFYSKLAGDAVPGFAPPRFRH